MKERPKKISSNSNVVAHLLYSLPLILTLISSNSWETLKILFKLKVKSVTHAQKRLQLSKCNSDRKSDLVFGTRGSKREHTVLFHERERKLNRLEVLPNRKPARVDVHLRRQRLLRGHVAVQVRCHDDCHWTRYYRCAHHYVGD